MSLGNLHLGLAVLALDRNRFDDAKILLEQAEAHYRALTDSFAKPSAFHVAFSRLGSDRVPITNTALLIATELDGKIVAVKKLLSR